MAKMPPVEKLAHDIAMKALEYEFDGKTIREWIEILKDYQYSKWISVEEKLPEEDGIRVLCAVKTYWGTCICEGYYSQTSNRVWPVDEDVELDEVTHWIPLPEPPKEE